MARHPNQRPALTDAQIKALKPPAKGVTEIVDGVVARLCIRITATGHRSWSVLYCGPVTKRQERVTLGSYPAVSLADARRAAKKVHGQVAQGEDPRGAVRAVREQLQEESPDAVTFQTVADLYLVQQQSLKSYRLIEGSFRNHLFPAFGQLPITAIRRRHLHGVIDELVTQGKRGAAREARKHMHAILGWAVSRDYIEHNVAAGMDVRALRVKKGEAKGRSLEDDELRALWTVLDDEGNPWRPALRLLLLTGCRRTEVVALKWSDVDLKAKQFVIEENKSGNRHVVPLNRAAMQELKSLNRFGGRNSYLFSFDNGKTHISPGSFTKMHSRLVNRMEKELGHEVKPFRPAHDYRVTAATRMSMIGISREVIEAVEGRAAPVLHATYNKHRFEAEKREALDALGIHLMELVEGGASNDAAKLG